MLQAQLAAFALVAMTLVASGCGSTKSASTSSAASSTAAAATVPAVITTPATLAAGKPLTSGQLIAQGDAICASTLTKLTSMSARSTGEFVRFLPQAAIYLGTEAESLSKLVPPPSMSHDWTQIVNDIHFASEYVNRVAQYAREKQEMAVRQLYAKANELNTQAKAIAKREGFQRCSRVR